MCGYRVLERWPRVKSSGCLTRKPGFGSSQHPHVAHNSKVSRDLVPFSGLQGYQASVCTKIRGSWKSETAEQMRISQRPDEDGFLPCGSLEKASNFTASSDRLESSVSLMPAHLSWQQQILLSLSGILRKQPLKISNYHIHCCQGTKTFLYDDYCSWLTHNCQRDMAKKIGSVTANTLSIDIKQ